MEYPQPKTPTITDNTTAHGLLAKTMIPKCAKSYDMQFNLLKCREAQQQFKFIWKRGVDNKADYHSKKHLTKHYVEKRSDNVVNMPLATQ